MPSTNIDYYRHFEGLNSAGTRGTFMALGAVSREEITGTGRQ